MPSRSMNSGRASRLKSATHQPGLNATAQTTPARTAADVRVPGAAHSRMIMRPGLRRADAEPQGQNTARTSQSEKTAIPVGRDTRPTPTSHPDFQNVGKAVSRSAEPDLQADLSGWHGAKAGQPWRRFGCRVHKGRRPPAAQCWARRPDPQSATMAPDELARLGADFGAHRFLPSQLSPRRTDRGRASAASRCSTSDTTHNVGGNRDKFMLDHDPTARPPRAAAKPLTLDATVAPAA
jgi:hypothetical protein